MKHKIVLSLCIALFLLAGVVISAVAILLHERNNTTLLQQHIAALTERVTQLEAGLEECRESAAAQ